MKINEIMTREVEIVHTNDPLQTVARKMRVRDIGFLPVYDGDQLIGTLSDRDLTIRAMAEGMNPKTIIGRDLVTSPAICCFEDQDVEDAARLMRDNQIRRLVILSRRDNRLAGVLSIGDLAINVESKLLSEVMQGVSEMVG